MKDTKCPNCGGELNTVPGSKNVKCAYCDSIFTIDDSFSSAEETGYAFEKGRQRAQREADADWNTAQRVLNDDGHVVSLW